MGAPQDPLGWQVWRYQKVGLCSQTRLEALTCDVVRLPARRSRDDAGHDCLRAGSRRLTERGAPTAQPGCAAEDRDRRVINNRGGLSST
jgi:hypothetical protein